MIYLSVGTVNPRVLLFLGIVTRKGIFVKLCVWLSNSNRSELILMFEMIIT